MNKTVILLVIVLVAYFLVREEKYSSPGLPFPDSPKKDKPKEEKPFRRPKVNRVEDDPLITPPIINHHTPRIQELIRLMWTDLSSMINFKNRSDPYDNEVNFKKKDCYEALKFTDYQQFKGFLERWKYGFFDWVQWKEYLKEWKKLDPRIKEVEKEMIKEWKKRN